MECRVIKHYAQLAMKKIALRKVRVRLVYRRAVVAPGLAAFLLAQLFFLSVLIFSYNSNTIIYVLLLSGINMGLLDNRQVVEIVHRFHFNQLNCYSQLQCQATEDLILSWRSLSLKL